MIKFKKNFNTIDNNVVNATVSYSNRALSDIEEQYKTICEISKDAVIVLDTRWKMLYCNPVYFSYTGYTPEEIIGRHFLKIPALVYSELPRIIKVFLKLLKGEKVSGFEFKFKMKTGQIRIGETEMAPLYSNGKVAGMLGIIRDVTDQKTAFEKLKRHYEKMSLALEKSNGGIWDWDIRNKNVYLSKSLEDTMGYSGCKDGINSSDWFSRIHQEDRDIVLKELTHYLKGRIDDYKAEFRFMVNDKEFKSFIIKGKVIQKDFFGKPVRMVGTAFDISSVKVTERMLDVAYASLNSVPESVFWMDKNGRLININNSAQDKLGYSREELLKMHIFDIDPLFTKKRWSEGWEILKEDKTELFESVHRKKDGTEFPVEVAINFLNFSGQEYVFALAADITERKKKEVIIKESEERYKSLAEKMFEGVWVLNSQAVTTFVNPQMAAVLGYEIQEMTGRLFIDFIDENSKECIIESIFRNKKSDKAENIFTFIRKNGKKAFLHLEIFQQPESGGELPGLILYAADVTEKIRMEEELKLKDSAMEASMNAIAILDLSYNVIYANGSFVKIFGYKNKNDAMGRKATEFIVFDDSFQIAATALFENGSVSGEYNGKKPDGTYFDIEQYANLVKKDGKPLAIMISVVDITAKKKEAERIKYLSFHDGLTGLYNRAYFEEELKRLDTPRQLPLSFIIGDLNSLKLVNDSYGHRFGDAMIARAAKIIKKYCRDEDVIARWGGDEFVILLPKANSETAESIIERIRKACEAYTYKKIPLSIALGNASKESQDESMNSVIKDAEENMYRRKLLERKSISGSIILSLEATLSEKSFETKEHTERLKKLAVRFGKKLNLPENQIGELSLLATLHDIGKVAIPESILTKEGQLNKKEWELVRRHPEIGSNIASSSPQIAHIAGAIFAAHEYWDGMGYPRGLKGEDIPLISRIVHIIDAFDVMRSGRPYKKPLNKATAIKELRSRAGTQFDPALVEEFISMIEQ
jgi:diguanylate cyclase (GGDEF)-like protein/PAS domain S-box-containing protein